MRSVNKVRNNMNLKAAKYKVNIMKAIRKIQWMNKVKNKIATLKIRQRPVKIMMMSISKF